MEKFLKLFLLSAISLLNISEMFASEQKCSEINYLKNQVYFPNTDCLDKDLGTKFTNSFKKYRSYKDAIKPQNQISDFLGIGGFPDQKLKRSVFLFWETFEKESTKQIGSYRLNGSDINNTFNQSLKELLINLF